MASPVSGVATTPIMSKTLTAFLEEAWTMERSQTPYATSAAPNEVRVGHASHTKKERKKRRKKKDSAVFSHDVGVVTHR